MGWFLSLAVPFLLLVLLWWLDKREQRQQEQRRTPSSSGQGEGKPGAPAPAPACAEERRRQKNARRLQPPPSRSCVAATVADPDFFSRPQVFCRTSEQVCMAEPVCLIENKRNGKLVVREEAAEILEKVGQPVVVVAIVGQYRTGKSYLMNRLAGKTKGFSLGCTVQAETKGIWMWCLPHPRRPDCTLVLLDTEGLGDVQKGSMENDSWIFALAILMSSTFVYNSIGTIDHTALEKLHYVTELTKMIRTKSDIGQDQEEESSAEFVRFFPAFIWAVRDFTLQLKIDGCAVTDDEYLESSLKLQQGGSEEIAKCNTPKLCIRKFFPSRKCITFDRPAKRKQLQCLENLEDCELAEDFLKPMSHFCQHVWETSQPKMLPGGQLVNGAMLAYLMKTYVAAIDAGEVPCLENAVLALSKVENSAAVQEAISHYEQCMERSLKLPTESMEEMLGVHNVCQREAMDVFMNRAFGENIKDYQEEFEDKLNQKKEEFFQRNKQASLDFCCTKLTELSQNLRDGIQRGHFCMPGGYKHFVEKLNKIEEDYRLTPGKGIQADTAFEDFRKSMEPMVKYVLCADDALNEKEKEIEAQRDQIRAEKEQARLSEEHCAKLKQIMVEEEHSHAERIQQLKEKMKEEKKLMEEEKERMIEHKVKEREQLLKEKFELEASKLQSEIQRLKEEDSKEKWVFALGIVEKVFNVVANVTSTVLDFQNMYGSRSSRGSSRRRRGK